MNIQYEGHDLTLTYSESSGAFALYDEHGEMFDRLDPPANHGKTLEPNMTWVDEIYVALLVDAGVVEKTGEIDETPDGTIGYETRIIHPEFNDGGYSPFGDFSRSRLGEQCQYGSRYITGRIEGFPSLGEGLRFLNAERSDYHSIRIHRDDMDEFERRYRAYLDARLARV